MQNCFMLGAAIVGSVVMSLSATAKTLPITSSGEVVEIANSGSTNTNGYIIFVERYGRVSYALSKHTTVLKLPTFIHGKITSTQAAKLFHDAASAMPLNKLPARHGFKSVSFGTSTYVVYKGQSSPDLSLPGNAQAQVLRDDAIAIADVLHLKNTPRRFLPFSRELIHATKH